MLKGLVFDMDGTLIDSLCVWEIVRRAFSDKYLNGEPFAISESDDKKVRTATLKETMECLHSKYLLGENADELLEEAERVIADFYKNTVKLKAGVSEFLEHCHMLGIKMCIASATDIKLLNLAIEHCKIGKYLINYIRILHSKEKKNDWRSYRNAKRSGYFVGKHAGTTVLDRQR